MGETKQTSAAPEPRNLYQRLLAIMGAAGAVAKTGKAAASQGSYPFHKIDDVEGVLRPLLVEHGVFVSVHQLHVESEQQTVPAKDGGERAQFLASAHLMVTFINADNPEERHEVEAYGEGIDTSDKGPGKAISYALKNCYLAHFHLRGGTDVEEDDHGRQPRQRPVPDAPPPPSPDPAQIPVLLERIRSEQVPGKPIGKEVARKLGSYMVKQGWTPQQVKGIAEWLGLHSIADISEGTDTTCAELAAFPPLVVLGTAAQLPRPSMGDDPAAKVRELAVKLEAASSSPGSPDEFDDWVEAAFADEVLWSLHHVRELVALTDNDADTLSPAAYAVLEEAIRLFDPSDFGVAPEPKAGAR